MINSSIRYTVLVLNYDVKCLLGASLHGVAQVRSDVPVVASLLMWVFGLSVNCCYVASRSTPTERTGSGEVWPGKQKLQSHRGACAILSLAKLLKSTSDQKTSGKIRPLHRVRQLDYSGRLVVRLTRLRTKHTIVRNAWLGAYHSVMNVLPSTAQTFRCQVVSPPYNEVSYRRLCTASGSACVKYYCV